MQFTLRANRGMDLPVHGSGTSVRSYLYVTDVANAYIIVLHKGQIGETYNIGTQKVRRNQGICAQLSCSDRPRYVVWPTPHASADSGASR